VISTIKQPLNSSVTVYSHHIIIVIVAYTYAIAFLIDTQRFQCPIGSPLRNGRAGIYIGLAVYVYCIRIPSFTYILYTLTPTTIE